jgi:hypothetical protein
MGVTKESTSYQPIDPGTGDNNNGNLNKKQRFKFKKFNKEGVISKRCIILLVDPPKEFVIDNYKLPFTDKGINLFLTSEGNQQRFLTR